MCYLGRRGTLSTLLALAACTLPLVVQADVAFVYPNADTYVDEWNPTTEHGADTNLGAGIGWPLRAFLNFDVTGAVPSGSVFQSAHLWLSVAGWTGAPVLSAHQVLEPWMEMGMTWDNQPAYAPGALDTQTGAIADWWWRWDVSGAWPGTGNLGLAVVGNGEEFGYVLFMSREFVLNWDHPHLLITYTDATDIPEPGTLGLLGALALPGLMLWRKRRRA